MKPLNPEAHSIFHNPDSKFPPLVVVVGPTASGKSALALELAKKFGGEIIAADSRTIYRGMDIGTAKPTADERRRVRHYLLDIVKPGERFTVADFQLRANRAIIDIASRGKLPIMVGGSGLYIDSVIYNYRFSEASAERDPINPRHLKRIESVPARNKRTNTLILGLDIDRNRLEHRIRSRIGVMVEAGLVSEVGALIERYGSNCQAFTAPAYQSIAQYVDGQLTLAQAIEEFVRRDLQLAKKQMTWFRRNKSIHWLEESSEASSLIAQFLHRSDTMVV